MLSSSFLHRMCRGVVAIGALALPLLAVPVFQVQAIGPAGYGSTATAINGAGAVVGNYFAADGTSRAYLWQDGQVTTLALPAGAVQTWASAISGAGQAGGYTNQALSTSGVVWDSAGNPVTTRGNYILGLNGNGDAAGMGIAEDGTGYAFVTRNGGLTSLGQPGGGTWSSAYAINAGGAAAGTAEDTLGAFRAFLAGADGSTTLLGGLGGTNSYAMAISDTGVVAGHAQRADGRLEATVWSGPSATGLGTLGGASSFAYAINSSGQVAGYSQVDTPAETAAFLYDSGTMYDLNTLLGPNSEWQLLAAYGMNNSGQIVGKGLLNGVEQAFLLTPILPEPKAAGFASVPGGGAGVPEPSSLWLVGPPVLAYFALRTRHR